MANSNIICFPPLKPSPKGLGRFIEELKYCLNEIKWQYLQCDKNHVLVTICRVYNQKISDTSYRSIIYILSCFALFVTSNLVGHSFHKRLCII